MLNLPTRRMPGIRFEPRAAQPDSALPRMDIAMFVGFASSGPLHVPVAVDDVAQFRAVFGDDAALAWDAQRGASTTALLAPTVRAFFANGGRRCWVVRVAGEDAACNHFVVPGLLAVRFEDNAAPASAPAFARARSKGSWSDSLRIGATLRQRPLLPAGQYDGGAALGIALRNGVTPAWADLVSISHDDSGRVMFAAVIGIKDAAGSPPSRDVAHIELGRRLCVERVGLHSPPPGRFSARASIFDRQILSPADCLLQRGEPHPFEREVPAFVAFENGDGEGRIFAELQLAPADAPAVGSLVALDTALGRLWVTVERIGIGDTAFSPPAKSVGISGVAWRLLDASAWPGMTDAIRINLLTLDLAVQEGSAAIHYLRDLGMCAGHARDWNALRGDDAYFASAQDGLRSGATTAGGESGTSQAMRDLDDARFPVSGAECGDLMFVPLGVPTSFSATVGAVRQSRSALERDGLSRMSADIFLDQQLASVSTDQIPGVADFVRYLSPRPHPLRGIHAALGWNDSPVLDEVTLIAVPDAVHRDWTVTPSEPPARASASSYIPHPEWWHFLPCDPRPEIPAEAHPDRAEFLDSDIREIAPPGDFGIGDGPDATGTLSLTWTCAEGGAVFEVQEANFPDFAGARIVYAGPRPNLTLYGRSRGDYYFRVRAIVGRNSSHWSGAVALSVDEPPRARLEPAERYSDDILLAVQRALVRMCAARGDLFAVLSVPSHYREQDAIDHVTRLGAQSGHESVVAGVAPLEPSETRALSYAALYHPWIVTRDLDGTLREIPPDGAAAGVLSARAATRGAWIAPANEALRDALALSPAILPERLEALQAAQVNVLRREPRGFLCLSADTLSTEPDLRPINVRRLLMLLRRLALRRGAVYVFEPLSDAFRRSVRRGFEALLFELFERGAFAGRTPEASYQVATGVPPNTTRGTEQGRFVVELKVAPAIPMRFLSVRLLNAGDRLSVVEGA